MRCSKVSRVSSLLVSGTRLSVGVSAFGDFPTPGYLGWEIAGSYA
jgi:hypothetical protein